MSSVSWLPVNPNALELLFLQKKTFVSQQTYLYLQVTDILKLYVCIKLSQDKEMRKSNRKLNFMKNRWASLFSRGQLKISKCSISLAWEVECSKSKVTPLLLHTIIYIPKKFQGPFFRGQGVNIFIYIQIVVTLQFLPGEIDLMI